MKLAVAMSMPTLTQNEKLAHSLSTGVEESFRKKLLLKVGSAAFTAGGPKFVKSLRRLGFDVVMDTKLHDIPDEMSKAAGLIAASGACMLTVHASASRDAVRAAKKAAGAAKVLAVTVLSSMGDRACREIYRRSVRRQAMLMVGEALHGGADGVVCSPVELPHLRRWAEHAYERCGPVPPFVRFVPGIELSPRSDDQTRKGGLREAIEGGADYVVVGRPVYESDDPAAVVNRLLRKAEEAERLRGEYVAACDW